MLPSIGGWGAADLGVPLATERPRRSTSAARRRALVIGGSVGGLFAAHLLRQIGWDVAVFERTAHELAGRGAGIGTSDALFGVLSGSA